MVVPTVSSLSSKLGVETTANIDEPSKCNSMKTGSIISLSDDDMSVNPLAYFALPILTIAEVSVGPGSGKKDVEWVKNTPVSGSPSRSHYCESDVIEYPSNDKPVCKLETSKVNAVVPYVGHNHGDMIEDPAACHEAVLVLALVGIHCNTSGNSVSLHGPTVVVWCSVSFSPSGLHLTILVSDTSYESSWYKYPNAIMP